MSQPILFVIMAAGFIAAGLMSSAGQKVRRFSGLVAFGGLALAYGPSLLNHIRASADPLTFTEDAVQHIAPYYTYARHVPADIDYPGAYYRACHPIGYRLMMTAAARVTDPRRYAENSSYILLLLFCVALAGATWPTAGPAGAAVICACALSSKIFLQEIAGGLPRSYAFPLVATACLAVVRGSPWLLAATVVAAALFYPAIAVTGGLALAAWLLLAPGPDLAARYNFRKRFVLVAATGALSAMLLVPNILALRPYGPPLRPADVVDYPEASSSGRLDERDQPGFARSPVSILRSEMINTLQSHGEHWVEPIWFWLRAQKLLRSVTTDALLLATLLTALIEARRNPAMRRLLILGTAALAAYGLSILATPYLFMPQRHMAYTWPLILLTLIVAAPATWGRWINSRCASRWSLRPILPALLGVGILICEGATIAEKTGMEKQLDAVDGLAKAAMNLPPDSVLAGWPETMDFVPYLTGRAAFMTRETWLPYHKFYADEMRKRFLLLMPSLLSAKAEDLQKLQKEYGVTHFVMDLKYATGPPRPFSMFKEPLRKAWRVRRDWLAAAPAESILYRNDRFVLVSVRALDAK